jgi:outer membrane protein assembly factor BamB
MKRISSILLLLILPLPLQGPETKDKQSEKEPQVIKLVRKNAEYSWGCRGVDEQEPNPQFAIPPLVISSDRLLVTVCNTLYMLDANQRVVWSWSTQAASLTDQPVIDSTGTIYVIAFDLIWVALDARTGVLKWKKDGNGRAVYSQIKLYKKDSYLVVVDMSGYTDGSLDRNPKDSLLLCKGKEVIWEKDFPAGAILQVWGDRILAVKPGKEGTVITEITP